MATEPMEIRMARLEGAYEQIDRRLGTIETDVRDLGTEMRGGFGELRAEMRRQFYWIVGLIIVAVLVPISLRFLPQ